MIGVISWMKDRLMTRLAAIATLLLPLAGLGCAQIDRAGTMTRDMYDAVTRAPRTAALRMEDRDFPDERRQGIIRLADRPWGRRAPYTERYAQIARLDEDHLVRATAIRALNRSRDKSSIPVFIEALRDQSELVRLEAAKALSNMPDPKAVQPLLALVSDPAQGRDVRIAVADALRHYKDLEVARTLAGQLGSRDFGVAWQSRQSLMNLTARDFRYNESAWLNFLTSPDARFG